MSKRIEFVKRKNLEENLKKHNAISVHGYYPLFNTIEAAEAVSPLTSYHTHEFEGVEYYMPEGLKMGVTQFHGDYDGQIIPETIIQEQQVEEEVVEPIQELPSVVTITPIEPDQEEELLPPPQPLPTPTPTYTPPPSTPSSGSGGGGY